MRLIPVTTIMLASVSLAACSHTWKPPEITYDPIAAPQPATPEVEPPKPVEIVQIPTPLPLPGQLQRIPPPPSQTPEPDDPRARVETANDPARIQPSRAAHSHPDPTYT